MNVSELSSADLDYWVARAEGYDADVVELYGWRYCRIDVYGEGWRPYEPTKNETLAARILFERFYTVGPAPLEAPTQHSGARRAWMAEAQMNPAFHGLYKADSPWVAICRLRVAEELSKNAALRCTYEQQHNNGRTA
jgi:hypothetical protein